MNKSIYEFFIFIEIASVLNMTVNLFRGKGKQIRNVSQAVAPKTDKKKNIHYFNTKRINKNIKRKITVREKTNRGLYLMVYDKINKGYIGPVINNTNQQHYCITCNKLIATGVGNNKELRTNRTYRSNTDLLFFLAANKQNISNEMCHIRSPCLHFLSECKVKNKKCNKNCNKSSCTDPTLVLDLDDSQRLIELFKNECEKRAKLAKDYGDEEDNEN